MIYFFIPNQKTAKSVQFLLHTIGYEWNSGQSLIELYHKKTKGLICCYQKIVYYDINKQLEDTWIRNFHINHMKYFEEDTKKISKFI